MLHSKCKQLKHIAFFKTSLQYLAFLKLGKKAIVIKSLPNEDHNSRTGLIANNSGFSLHAGVAVKANDRDKLEQICRYIARPAIAAERLSLDENGDVIYMFKKPPTIIWFHKIIPIRS